TISVRGAVTPNCRSPGVPCRVVTDSRAMMDATLVRSRVMTAAAMAAQALTDTEQPPDGRLRTLMDAHGRILAARGPLSPLTFSNFRDLLTQDLASLLPDGVPA